MSTERNVTIVSDSYALWGSLPVGPAGPVEPTPEERRQKELANRITYSQLKAEYHVTDEGFDVLKAHGFPASIGRVIMRAKLGESFWRRDAIARWMDGMAAAMAMMQPRNK